MDDSKWERWANLGGVFFVVCAAISFLLPGSPPKTSDSATKIADFLADKGDQVRWSGYIGALGVIGLFWWLGSVWRLLRRADGGTPRLAVMAVAAATFAAALATLSGVMLGALPIIGARTLNPAEARLFYIIATNVGIVTVIGIAAFLTAFSAAIIRSHVLPVWLGWVGAIIALGAVFGAASVATTRDAVFYGSAVAFGAFLLWTLVVAIIMFVRSPEPETTTTPTTASAV